MSANMLNQETSPYLLQHKDNPVHWRAWGEGAPGAEGPEGGGDSGSCCQRSREGAGR